MAVGIALGLRVGWMSAQDEAPLPASPNPPPEVQEREKLAKPPARLVQRDIPLTSQTLSECCALDVGHHVVEEPVCLTGVMERQDVGVREPGGDLDLLEEALRTDGMRQFRLEHLHGYRAPVSQVPGEVHRRHPAAAELTLETVTVGERSLKLRLEVWQVGPSELRQF